MGSTLGLGEQGHMLRWGLPLWPSLTALFPGTCASWGCSLRPAPDSSLSRSYTTTTKESHSRPFSLLPSEPCDRPWESPHTCPQPT